MSDHEQIQRDRQARDILLRAVEMQSGEARAAYLEGACQGDASLRSRVDALLANHQEDAFLEIPAIDERPLAIVSQLTISEGPGTVIGRYKLLEKIGEGGFGVVYVAEQREPVKRRVALKIIRLGLDTRQVVGRFETERQALALMDHPNIAKVLDGGATETGRPYFVMELVRGIPITQYCNENQLAAHTRLKLFILVCQAIQHAHQKGIIHRDIKPSNILLTVNDGAAVPKVIDFGIAKATQGELSDKTVYTQFQQFIGTPAYMSPEQADMTSLDVDTRSDIYALGVLLYELLVGQTPFDAKQLMASGLDAMRKTIREREPVRPSTKLGQTLAADEMTRRTAKFKIRNPKSETDEAASRWRLRIKETIYQLKGDLDWIVMKCLEKDRTRRYETANGLAADINRFLSQEPIAARPPSQLYRLQKMVKRNTFTVAAGTAVAASLVVGIAVSTWQAVRATRAEHDQAQLRGEAVQQRNQALAARAAADEATRLAEQRAAEINRNLYFAEMNLAGTAAAEPGGISRIADLTTKWLPAKGAADQRGWEWFYLRSLLHLDLFTLSGHANEVNSVAWSPDGKRLASGSADNTIKIWDATSRKVTLTLTEHTNVVKSVAWSPDGKRLASGSYDNTIKVWDTLSGQVIHTLRGHSGAVVSVAWRRDGKRLSSGSYDKTIKVWDADNGVKILTLPGHSDGVASVAWSPDGSRLASGSFDETVRVWDAENGRVIHTLRGHTFWVHSVAWNPDGKRLASASGDLTVKVWDAVDGTNINTLLGHFDAVRSVSWSPDGQRLASAGEDSTVKVWDATNGRNTFTNRGHTKYVCSVAWSPDGKQLASGSEDNTIKIWDSAREETLTLRGHTKDVFAMAWSPDGMRLASASSDNTVKVWDPDSGQEVRTLSGHTNVMTSVAWSRDGKFLVSGCRDSTIQVWDVASWHVKLTLHGHVHKIAAVSFSPDGKRLAAGFGPDESINLYDATNGQEIRTLRGHDEVVHSVAWSPDGKFLASGSWDKTVRVWDPVSGRAIQTLRDVHSGDSGGFTEVAWSRDGKHLAAGCFDGTTKIWDAASGELIQTLRGHSGGLLSLSWSADGQRLASGSFDRTVKVWDAASGHEILTLRGYPKVAHSVAWSPDGKRLASCSFDNTIKVWDARKGYALESE